MNVISADYNSIEITTSHGGELRALNVLDFVTSLKPKIDTPVKKQNIRNELLNQLYEIYLNESNKELFIKNKKRL